MATHIFLEFHRLFWGRFWSILTGAYFSNGLKLNHQRDICLSVMVKNRRLMLDSHDDPPPPPPRTRIPTREGASILDDTPGWIYRSMNSVWLFHWLTYWRRQCCSPDCALALVTHHFVCATVHVSIVRLRCIDLSLSPLRISLEGRRKVFSCGVTSAALPKQALQE